MVEPFVAIVVEGALEVPAAQKILESVGLSKDAPRPSDKRGRNAFWADIAKYNRAARNGPVFALADLEQEPCFGKLVKVHLPEGRHPNLILRLAAPMLESWLLADRTAIAAFLRVSIAKVPIAPERETHPKQTLVNLARRSRSRVIREDLVPPQGMSGMVGPNYTAKVSSFIREHWQPVRASRNSPSLKRALAALTALSEREG